VDTKGGLEEDVWGLRESFATLARMYGALTSLNALAREDLPEEEFLSGTISLLVERGGFTAAGFYFCEGETLRLGVHHITDPENNKDRHPLFFSLDPSSPDAKTGAVRAFQSGAPVFIDDLDLAYREAGLARRADDYKSISFRGTGLCPIARGGRTVGVFAVVSDRTDFFTPEIRELLIEASRIVSFTLDHIDTECARRQSEEYFRTLVDAIPDGVWLKDGRGAWRLVNRAGLELFGLADRSDWSGKTDEELSRINPSFSLAHLGCLATDEKAWQESSVSDAVEAVTGSDGSLHVIESRKVPLFAKDGSRQSLVVIGRDVTERLMAEEERNLSEKIFEASPFAIFVADNARRIVRVNPAFTAITGYEPGDVLGKTSRMLASSDVTDDFSRSLWEHVDSRGSWSGEVWCRKRTGEGYWGWFDINVIKRDDVKTGYFGLFSDITRRKEDEERIVHQAFHDALTDLPNRRAFMMRLEEELVRAGRDPNLRFAVGILDLDGFKEVNDRYGHPAGDELLVHVSRRLEKVRRSTDTLARLGGDEFGLLFSGIGEGDAVFDRIIATLRAPIAVSWALVAVSGSLGVTFCPPDRANSDTLLSHADSALYEVKKKGRNGWGSFSPAGG